MVLTLTLYAQPQQVRIRFEVEGKSRVGPQTIEFYGADGHRIASQRIHQGCFDVPKLQPSEQVNVCIYFAKRVLTFQGVYGTKFEGTWTVGIDRVPFDEENASSIPAGNNSKELWFIEFEPSTGDGTRMVVTGR